LNDDSRPALAIGHVTLRSSDVGAAAKFYRELGLRPIMETAGMAIFELRGGTHLLLFRAKGKPKGGPVRSFDFMVDDVDAFRERIAGSGVESSPLTVDDRGGHRWFEVRDPDGHRISIYSSHVEGRSV
jgi:catechol 2,3-dioxygenase-like lactoylglutathione lyase family enzyme